MIKTLKPLGAGAVALLLASTAAQAATVGPGGQLIIQVGGSYSVTGGGAIMDGSDLVFSGPFGLPNMLVSQVTATGPVDLQGLAVGATVTVSGGPFTFGEGGPSQGMQFTFSSDVNPTFTLGADSFNLTMPATATGTRSLDGLGTLNGDSGSWGFSTTGDGTGGGFTMAFAIPPVATPPVDPIPLPAAGWLLLSGIAGLGGLGWMRRRAA